MGASEISEYGSSVESDPGGEGKLGRKSEPPQSTCLDGARGFSAIGSKADTVLSNMECMGGNSQLFLQGLD
jgi:hypothetical protein